LPCFIYCPQRLSAFSLLLQLGSPTVQLSTFPPPPSCADNLLPDSGGGGVASTDSSFRVLANPSTGFELKTNVVRSSQSEPSFMSRMSFSFEASFHLLLVNVGLSAAGISAVATHVK
jgi:hypothetical protein